ncbi:MAG: nucleotidyltransferase family protein [bacterium]|nr:MAG: nucleotidyltransferase family protein [bacterium]
MQAVILAAGFGERLRPYTERVPKALLEVGGRPVIDHLLDFLFPTPDIETIHIRTNGLYYPLFKDWLRGCEYMGKVELSTNGVNTPEGKLGAVGDIEDFCSRKRIQEDFLVAAGDNIFGFSIQEFLDFCSDTEGDVVVVTETRSKKALKEGGVVRLTSNGRIIDFEEKPQKPKSNMLALPFYRLSAESIPFLRKYLMGGNDRDCIGSFFTWSYRRRPLFAYQTDGVRYHLTDPASYKKACSAFEKTKKV